MKLEKATIHNTKIGDKCYIEVGIKNIGGNEIYPIDAGFCMFSDKGVRLVKQNQNQLYHIRQEEIPTLGEGIEMYVSDDGKNWEKAKIIAKHENLYCDSSGCWWEHIRPIQLTIEQKLENALKEIEELKKQLNK